MNKEFFVALDAARRDVFLQRQEALEHRQRPLKRKRRLAAKAARKLNRR